MAEENPKPEAIAPAPAAAAPAAAAPEAAGDALPFFPKVILREFIALLLVIGVVVAMAVFIPVDYEEKVNTLVTPAGVKAEWYFLWTYELMKLVPVLVGMGILGGIVILILVLPWIDSKPERKISERVWVLAGGFLILAFIGVLTVWALFPGGE